MKWIESRSAFECDGSLRDLYVLDTSREDWQRLLDLLRSSRYPLHCIRSDGKAPVPENVDGCFSGEADWCSLISIDVHGVAINTHFFTDKEIEFDIDPREVQTEDRAAAVFEFMRRVGRALGKPIRLTPENASEVALFEYDPVNDTMRART